MWSGFETWRCCPNVRNDYCFSGCWAFKAKCTSGTTSARSSPPGPGLPGLAPRSTSWLRARLADTVSADVGSKGEPTADSLPEATVLCFSFFQAVSLEVLLYSRSAWTHRLPSCSRQQEAEMPTVRYVTARQPEARWQGGGAAARRRWMDSRTEWCLFYTIM